MHQTASISETPEAVALPLAQVDIPQANDLMRVVVITRAIHKRQDLSEAGFVHPRDRAYYTRAACVLGLLDEARELTLLGWKVATATPDEARPLLRIAFERSVVGSAWLEWSGASSVTSLTPTSAVRFLQQRTNLAPSTASRRASTLQHWVRTLCNARKSTIGASTDTTRHRVYKS